MDLNSDFSFSDIVAKRSTYKTLEEAANDLFKVCRYITSANSSFIVKEIDTSNSENTVKITWQLKYVSKQNFEKQLKTIQLFKPSPYSSKRFTLYDAFTSHVEMFSFDAVMFNLRSDKPKIMSLFNNFKYEPIEDNNRIQFFLSFVHDVICDENDELTEYVLNWCSYIFQNTINQRNPKTTTALVLKGAHGIGKGRFTDILSELLAPYSVPNITNIDEICGTFNSVLMGKLFLVCNEMMNVGERMSNFDALKSIITDSTIRINEKGVPRFSSLNVANLIIVSNNPYPVRIESTDRRYIVLDVNGKYMGNTEYWDNFMSQVGKEFYSALTYYFLNKDITNWNPRNIIKTQAHKSLQSIGGGKFGNWINLNYNQLTTNGIRVNELMSTRPKNIDVESFKLYVRDKCRMTKRNIGETRKNVWVLKDEYRDGYHQIDYEGNDLDENYEIIEE